MTPDFSEVAYSDAGESNTGKSTPSFTGARAQIVGDGGLTVTDAMAASVVRDWGVHPRARDLPAWRDAVQSCWEPDGPYTSSTNAMRRMGLAGTHDYIPRWEYLTMGAAQLWYVGAPMCDLLDGAAPGLPPTVLTRSVMPDEEGMVFFEAPLAGVDANGSEVPVTVGAYLWGRAQWHQPVTGKVRPVVGVTIYGPSKGLIGATTGSRKEAPVMLIPLGGLIWPFGTDTDFVAFDGGPRDLSMQEDRRRLLALWLLSAQPSLTSSTIHEAQVTTKAKAKRIKAGKARRDPPVRVVQLRRNPNPDSDAPERGEGGRTYRHRWTVSGHWRNQAVGPHHSQRRPTYINTYLKGPDDAPLIGTERVKSWVR